MANRPGKALFLRQRRGQRRALAHQHQRVERVGAHGAVVQGFGGGLQRLEDGHARARQHGQGAGKARRVVAARQFAHQRQVQPGGIKFLAKIGFLAPAHRAPIAIKQ
jgi:hypothetical protein